MQRLMSITLAITLALAAASCAGTPKPIAGRSADGAASLYERLGGQEAIRQVVDATVARVAADPRINGYFASTDIPRLKRLMVEQICEATGGPCTYHGRSMRETHRGMGVTDAAFNALVEDLVATLDEFKVPAKEKQELLALLGPMRSDIVEPR